MDPVSDPDAVAAGWTEYQMHDQFGDWTLHVPPHLDLAPTPQNRAEMTQQSITGDELVKAREVLRKIALVERKVASESACVPVEEAALLRGDALRVIAKLAASMQTP